MNGDNIDLKTSSEIGEYGDTNRDEMRIARRRIAASAVDALNGVVGAVGAYNGATYVAPKETNLARVDREEGERMKRNAGRFEQWYRLKTINESDTAKKAREEAKRADYLFGDSRMYGLNRQKWETKDFVDEGYEALKDTNTDARLKSVFATNLPKGKPGTYIKREIMERLLGDNKVDIDSSNKELLKIYNEGYVSTTPENLRILRETLKKHENTWMPLKSMQ